MREREEIRKLFFQQQNTAAYFTWQRLICYHLEMRNFLTMPVRKNFRTEHGARNWNDPLRGDRYKRSALVRGWLPQVRYIFYSN